MALQADINWIISELQEIKDPKLIQSLKDFLRSKQTMAEEPFQEYNREVEAADKRIDSGEFITHEEMLKAMGKW